MLMHQNGNDYNVPWKEFKAYKKLQCSLDRVQNRKQVNFCWKSLKLPLPGLSASCGLPFKGGESVEHWQCWFPSSQTGTSSVSISCLGNNLSFQLRVRMKITQEKNGPPGPPDWGKKGITCLEHVSVNKEIQMCTAKFWPTILLVFFLNCLHSLMQNTFFNRQMRFGKWNSGFCLLWHNKSIIEKHPQGEISSPSIAPGLFSVIQLHMRNGQEMLLQYSSLRCSSAKC